MAILKIKGTAEKLKLCSLSARRLSDTMQSPTTTLDESVMVVWEKQ